MNLVFLTSESPHHWYLINRVHEVHPVAGVFCEAVPTPSAVWSRRFKRLLSSRHVRLKIRQIIADTLFHRERQRQCEYEQRMFFAEGQPELSGGIPCHTVNSFNTPDGVKVVAQTEPDLIVVFGTRILKGQILNLARVDMLNIHRGILPKYRGGGLPMWELYHNDFQSLGVTIHQCTAQLDAGAIVGQKHYVLEPDDGIHTLRYKTTRLAADLLIELIRQYRTGTVERITQPPTDTKPFTARDLTLSKQLAARRNLRRHVHGLNP
jgi:methionyl-tRNA formyltransferase